MCAVKDRTAAITPCCVIINPHSALTALRLPPLSHLAFQGEGKSKPLGFTHSRKSAILN